MPLQTSYDDLHDLAASAPELVDDDSHIATGIRLQRLIDTGGMATVFYAERDEAPAPRTLSPLTPRALAIKIMQPAAVAQLR